MASQTEGAASSSATASSLADANQTLSNLSKAGEESSTASAPSQKQTVHPQPFSIEQTELPEHDSAQFKTGQASSQAVEPVGQSQSEALQANSRSAVDSTQAQDVPAVEVQLSGDNQASQANPLPSDLATASTEESQRLSASNLQPTEGSSAELNLGTKPNSSAAASGSVASPVMSERSIPGQPKKFSSSLSVNKKFLEKASADPKSASSSRTGSPAAAPQRIPTPLAAAPTPLYQTGPSPLPSSSTLAPPSAGPRLLTGKISTSGVPGHGPAGSASSGGWGRQLRSPSADLPAPTFFDQPRGSAYASNTGRNQQMGITRGGFQAQGMSSGRGRGGRPMGSAPWANHGQESMSGFGRASGGWGMSGEFPSVAEASRSKELKARALATALAAKEAKDKSSKLAAAEAAAAYRKHLLEDLDAFRGTHLDPNANHWDEMDEDDDFGDIVDFGDGATYKIPLEDSREMAPSPARPAAPSASFGQAQPSTSSVPPAGEFDRGNPHSRAVSENRSLFNDRLGKLEPYDQTARQATKSQGRNDKRELPAAQVLKRPERHQAAPSSSQPLTAPTQQPPAPKTVNTSTENRPKPPPKQAWAIPTPAPSTAAEKSPFSAPALSPLPAQSALQQPGAPQATPAPVERTPVAAPEPVESLEEVHKREMQLAVERARKRKQEEADARQAAIDRARSKAQAMEQALQAQAPKKESTPISIQASSTASVSVSAPVLSDKSRVVSDKSSEPRKQPSKPQTGLTTPSSQSISNQTLPAQVQLESKPIETSTSVLDSSKKQSVVSPDLRPNSVDLTSPVMAPVSSAPTQTLPLASSTETLPQKPEPQPNRVLANALKPATEVPSRAEESSSWRRTTAPPPSQPKRQDKVREPRAFPASTSAPQHDTLATVPGDLPRKVLTEASSRIKSPVSAKDAILRPKVSSPDARSIPAADEHRQTADKAPTVHLSGISAEAKSSAAPRLPYKAAEMSSLNDAMSRLQELLGSGKSRLEAASSTSDKKSSQEEVSASSSELSRQGSLDRSASTSTQQTVLRRALSPVPDAMFAISSTERPSSPRPVWKVIPKLKIGGKGRNLPPLSSRQQSNLQRQNRPDRLFTVSWNTSRSEGLLNLFREQALFPLVKGSPVLRLPGSLPIKETQTTPAQPPREVSTTTVETAQTVFNLMSDQPQTSEDRSIAVILPKIGVKGSSRGPTVKLPGKSGLVPSNLPSEASGDILDASMPIWNETDRLGERAFRYPTPQATPTASSFNYENSAATPSPLQGDGIASSSHRRMPSASAAQIGSAGSSSDANLYHKSSRSVSGPAWDESPLSLSVVKNVWAQPSISEDASANNSLRDLVDDFPSTLPSMNDLKAEDDSSADGASDRHNQAPMYSRSGEAAVGVVGQSLSGHSHPISTFGEQYSSPATTMSMTAPFQPTSSPYARENPSPWQRPMMNNHQYGTSQAYHQQPYPSYSPNMATPDFSNGIWLPQQPSRNMQQKQMSFGNYGAMDSPSYVPAGLPGAQVHAQRSSARNFSKGRSSHDTPFGSNAFGNMQMARGGPNAYLNPPGMNSGPAVGQTSPYGRF